MGMNLIWVRANVTLPGFPVGQCARVDSGKDTIRRYIAAGYLHVCTLDEGAELDSRAGLTEGGQR
jgi:hypothetical protein